MPKRIAHITDTHFDDTTALGRGSNPRDNFAKVLEQIKAQGVDSIVFTGDIGHELPGFEQTYDFLFDSLNAAGLPYKAILGNHDHYDVAKQRYKGATDGDGELYFAYEEGGYKYIYLDSSSTRISPEQHEWLEQQVDTSLKIILFIHHPVVGLHNSGMDKIYPLNGRERITRLLQQCKHRVTVFCGHYHMIDARQNGNIIQYITPSIAFQVRKDSPSIDIYTDYFGYRIINIDDVEITTQVYINRGHGFEPAG